MTGQSRLRGGGHVLPDDGQAGSARAGDQGRRGVVRRLQGEQPAVQRRRARRAQLRAAVSRDAREEASRSGEALSRYPRAREFGRPQPAQPVLQAGAGAARGGRPRGELRHADAVDARRRHADRPAATTSRPRSGCGPTRSSGRCTSQAASARPATRDSAKPYALAEHLRVRRDLCGAHVHDVEPPAVHGHRRRQVHRRARTRHVQQRARGVSQSGNRFFYVNRLASAGDGRDARWERASLECCPPNLVRFLASMPGYIYAQDQKQAIYVNLYVSSEASFNVGGLDDRLVGRERDAVGRQDAPHGVGWRRHSLRGQAADSRLGAQPACSR